jgi:hypothetical protein
MNIYCGYTHEDLLWIYAWIFTVDTFMKVYCGYMHEDYCGYMHEDLLWIHS